MPLWASLREFRTSPSPTECNDALYLITDKGQLIREVEEEPLAFKILVSGNSKLAVYFILLHTGNVLQNINVNCRRFVPGKFVALRN